MRLVETLVTFPPIRAALAELDSIVAHNDWAVTPRDDTDARLALADAVLNAIAETD